MRNQVEQFMRSLQDDICTSLEKLDGYGHFVEDLWDRDGGGGGRSRVITGQLIEKGGVNYSAVYGVLPERIRNALGIPAHSFYATGVSIVLHPVNPWVPIIHMNVRYFDTDSGHSWFGGGIDITPHYIIIEDTIYFHDYLKQVCDNYSSTAYEKFKRWADDYFYIKHRNETRGVGGIFFDRLSNSEDHSMEDHFQYVQDVGNAFFPIYKELASRNRKTSYTEDHRSWQLHRRGRYVEFNLVWDKGTKFGLDTGGRTESILMSMPPDARWTYDHKVRDGSPEATTLSLLKKGIDWVNYNAM